MRTRSSSVISQRVVPGNMCYLRCQINVVSIEPNEQTKHDYVACVLRILGGRTCSLAS